MKRHIEEYPPNFGDGESVLTMLYECHNENSQIHIGTGGIGIVHVIQEVRGGEPHDLTAAIGIDGQGNREWTFDIAFLVFIGAQFKACQLAESIIGGIHQLGHSTVGGAAHSHILGDGNDCVVTILDQRISDGVAFRVRQQHVGIAHVVFRVIHNDNASFMVSRNQKAGYSEWSALHPPQVRQSPAACSRLRCSQRA